SHEGTSWKMGVFPKREPDLPTMSSLNAFVHTPQVDYLIKQLDKKYKESQEKGALAQHDETFANLAILSAKEEVKAYLRRLQEVLDLPLGSPPLQGPRVQNWLEGSGYITAWGELHRIEEALIMLSPLELRIDTLCPQRL